MYDSQELDLLFHEPGRLQGIKSTKQSDFTIKLYLERAAEFWSP